MDFKSVIEFVKYTLTLTAACFVYSLEKLVPSTNEGRLAVLGLLIVFAGAALAGIFIFSSSTAALHGDKERTERQKRRIERASYAHVGLLSVGVLVLSVTLASRVLTEPPKPPQICFERAASMSEPSSRGITNFSLLY